VKERRSTLEQWNGLRREAAGLVLNLAGRVPVLGAVLLAALTLFGKVLLELRAGLKVQTADRSPATCR